jgi:hypothetical protein
MEMENTLGYCDTVTITTVKSFKVDAAGWRVWREKSNFNSFSRLIYKIHCAPKKSLLDDPAFPSFHWTVSRENLRA